MCTGASLSAGTQIFGGPDLEPRRGGRSRQNSVMTTMSSR
jgi:hypothetical protein